MDLLGWLRSAQGRQRLFFAGELLLALLLLVLLQGYRFPGGDLLQQLPRITQLSDPGYLANDLYFGEPARNYTLVTHLLGLLGSLVPLRHAVAGLTVLNALLLLYSATRLTRHLAGRPVSPLVVATVAVIAGAWFGGNIISAPVSHPQLSAFAFLALAVALIVEQRLIGAALALLGTGFFHPLVGLYGLGYLGLALLIARPWRWRTAALVSGIALVVFFVTIWPSILPSIGGDSAGQDSAGQDSAGRDSTTQALYARLIVYVAAPSHNLVSAWHPSWSWELALSLLLLGLASRNAGRAVQVGVLYFAGLWLIGVLNANLVRVPALVVAHPQKVGPVLLLLLWCLIARWLLRFDEEGRALSVALILAATSLWLLVTLLGLVLVVRAGVSRWQPLLRQRLPSLATGDAAAALGGVLLLLILVVRPLQLAGPREVLLLLLAMIAAVVVQAIGIRQRLVVLAALMITARLGLALSLGELQPWGATDPPRSADWVAVCNAVRELTPADACVVIPPEQMDFALLAERSAFVCRKHFPFRPADAVEWARRLVLLRALPPSILGETGPTAEVRPDPSGYDRLGTAELQALARQYGVTHCIVRSSLLLDLPALFRTWEYTLYRLAPGPVAAEQPMPLNRPAVTTAEQAELAPGDAVITAFFRR